jgi:hypothetical protein
MRSERCVVLAALTGALLVAALPARAHHNDWAAPLVGGALGGYALGTLVSNSSREHTEKVYESSPAPVYYTPAPAPVYAPVPVVPSSSTIEAQLNQLDKLAAAGYITPAEYQTRRNAILNQL